MVVYHGYKTPMLFEVRGLPVNKASQTAEGKENWKMDNYKGASIGNVIECENGYVVIASYTTATIFDKDGKEIVKFDGKKKKGEETVKTPTGLTADSGGHHGNWIKAIRSRDIKDLNADVLEGHLSAGLVHTGNISYRLGAQKNPGEIKEALKDNKNLAEAFDRMAGHLDANGVDMAADKLALGIPLKFDPVKEKFEDNGKADAMLTRNYREPFVVPEKV